MGAQERAGGMGALLVEAGAIEALLRGMHRYSDKAKVQETVGKCMHLFSSVPFSRTFCFFFSCLPRCW